MLARAICGSLVRDILNEEGASVEVLRLCGVSTACIAAIETVLHMTCAAELNVCNACE